MNSPIEVKFNKKLKIILDNKNIHENVNIDLNCLNKLFFPDFKNVYDCIVISLDDINELEKDFNPSIEYLGGKNYYEISETEILINSFLGTLEQKYSLYTLLQLTLMVVQVWKIQLKTMDSSAKFCFIISCDLNCVTLRFHKVRKKELGWLADDLEIYKEPIGYIIY